RAGGEHGRGGFRTLSCGRSRPDAFLRRPARGLAATNGADRLATHRCSYSQSALTEAHSNAQAEPGWTRLDSCANMTAPVGVTDGTCASYSGHHRGPDRLQRI